MDKFLILGGNSRLANCFSSLYPDITEKVTKADCDITNKKAVDNTLKTSKASYILNCAALTDIKQCEKNPVKCFEVNAIAVDYLEKGCKKYNKKLIHLSSDYALYPLNIYGLSKLIGEKILDEKDSLIIRTSFYSKNTYLVKSLLNKKKVNAYPNMYFNPLSINRLVKEIYKNRNKKGLLNIFTSKRISKYSFALNICRVFGINAAKVKAVEFKNKPGFVQRPLNSYVKSNFNILLRDDLIGFYSFVADSK